MGWFLSVPQGSPGQQKQSLSLLQVSQVTCLFPFLGLLAELVLQHHQKFPSHRTDAQRLRLCWQRKQNLSCLHSRARWHQFVSPGTAGSLPEDQWL